MMKAIVIIAVILLLLVLFSLLPIKLYVKYENEAAVVKAGLLFFRFQIFPQKEKKPKKRKRKKKPTKAHESVSVKQLLVDALIDLMVGTLLILIDRII